MKKKEIKMKKEKEKIIEIKTKRKERMIDKQKEIK